MTVMSVMAPLSCMMEVFAFEDRSAFLCTMQASVPLQISTPAALTLPLGKRLWI